MKTIKEQRSLIKKTENLKKIKNKNKNTHEGFVFQTKNKKAQREREENTTQIFYQGKEERENANDLQLKEISLSRALAFSRSNETRKSSLINFPSNAENISSPICLFSSWIFSVIFSLFPSSSLHLNSVTFFPSHLFLNPNPRISTSQFVQF